MDKSKLVEKQGPLGDGVEIIPLAIQTNVIVLILALVSFLMRKVPELSTFSWIPYLVVILMIVVLLGRFIYIRFENSTRNRWFRTRNAGGWIEQDAYGLLQFRYDNTRYMAYIGSFNRVVLKTEPIQPGPHPYSIPKEMFEIRNGRVFIPEKLVIEVGFPISYQGQGVRAYLDDALVYCDKGAEEELAMYLSLK